MRKYGNFGNKTRRSGQNPKTLLPFSIFDLPFLLWLFSSKKITRPFSHLVQTKVCAAAFFSSSTTNTISKLAVSLLFSPSSSSLDQEIRWTCLSATGLFFFFPFSCAHQLHVKIVKRLPEKKREEKRVFGPRIGLGYSLEGCSKIFFL